ncbi:MAG: terminase family protein [Syntrophobacterales bacterium]|nr:terminase family protein [Syntrophobacterales bacterium]
MAQATRHKGNAKIRPANPDGLFLPYQERWILDRSRLKLMEKARQIGLSWSTSYAATERTAERGAKWDQWVSSRDDLQARLFVEDCKMWAKMLQLAAEDLGERVIDEEKKLSAYVLHFASGRRIHSMSSNPDAQAGKRGGRVLDEFALHPDPRKLWSIAYPGITWGGSLEVISTHRGSANFFNQLIREVREHKNPKKISMHRVTLQDALDEGFLFKLQRTLPAGHDIQAMDEAEYYDFIKSGCADEESFLQEYMCEPADDAAAFLEYDLIAKCEYGEGERWEMELPEGGGATSHLHPDRGMLYGGLDIGRKKDLTVLWVLELLGDVLYTRKVIALKSMSKPNQEKILWPWLAILDRCCLDYTGLGIGWGDDAKKKFGEYRIETVTFTPKVKEALAYPVRGAMEDRRLRIPYDPKIRADLRAVTKETTAAGNIRFTAERSEDGHADRFWALALAVHAKGNTTAAISLGRDPERRESAMGRDYMQRMQGGYFGRFARKAA